MAGDASSLPGRLLALLRKIAQRQVDSAKAELRGDVQRLLMGVVALGMMGLFSIHAVIFAHVLLVVGLYSLGLPLWGVVGAVFFGDVGVVLLAAIAARFLLLRPLLPRTRKQLGDAWTLLVG